LKKERQKLKGKKPNNSIGRFSESLPAASCPEPVEGLPPGQSFANSVTREKPTNKVTGVLGVHQFLLAEESRLHPGIVN